MICLLRRFFQHSLSLLGIAFSCFLLAYIVQEAGKETQDAYLGKFKTALVRKEIRLQEKLKELATDAEKYNYDELFRSRAKQNRLLLDNEGLVLLIYEGDTLRYWSDNSIAVENYLRQVCLDDQLAKLQNGWFEVMHDPGNTNRTKSVIGLILLKHEYPYQNRYLENNFPPDYGLPDNASISTIKNNGLSAIHTLDGHLLFYLQLPSSSGLQGTSLYLFVLLALAGIFFLLFFLREVANSWAKRIGYYIPVLCYTSIIILLRALTIYFKIPSIIYSEVIFHPELFGDATSFWLPSLGDLLINAILILHLSYFIYKHCFNEAVFSLPKSWEKPFAVIILLCLFWFSWLVNRLFTGLIHDSKIPFDFSSLFDLSFYSLVGLAIIFLLFLSFFLVSDKLTALLLRLPLKGKELIYVFLVAATIHIVMSHISGMRDFISITWAFAPLIALLYAHTKKQRVYSFPGIILFLTLFTLYGSHTFLKHLRYKEMDTRKVYAEKLAAEQDPIAEYLYDEIHEKIICDTSLQRMMTARNKDLAAFEKRLIQEYFGGYWEKYEVRVIAFDSMCVPVSSINNPSKKEMHEYDECIKYKGNTTFSPSLFLLPDAQGKISYLAKIVFNQDKKRPYPIGSIYIELNAKLASEEIGFPELLLDKELSVNRQLSNYSYAKYKNQTLVNHFGKYPYPLHSYKTSVSDDKSSTFHRNHFDHLVYRPDAQTVVILSHPDGGIFLYITTFSYLFTLLSVFVLMAVALRNLERGIGLVNLTLKYRIQLLLISVVLLSLIVLGGGSIYYIQNEFEVRNKEIINEKMRSALMDLESNIGSENQLYDNNKSHLVYLLKNISQVFFTDINLFDHNGNIFASSRPQIFDKGLVSKKINPVAYTEMAIEEKTEFIHQEVIGKLKYYSSYAPVHNKNGKVIGFLNLSYFAKQNELQKEISMFLEALINIYVLLLAFTVLIAIFISNYVTLPLKLIQEKISGTKLGKENEYIDWQHNDEIGSLVKEYNRMIDELAMSANQLAQSERENAWREMAKQVAHEIKNPLTPMKLNVQHLQRMSKDGSPDMDKKIERFTESLIQQIDTLSNIANAFSDFAKMPQANKTPTDLIQVLKDSVELFKSSPSCSFHIENRCNESEAIVNADKDQLLRIFNNLIKNAVQAIPVEKEGLIEVIIDKSEKHYLVEIRDNGKGISSKEKEKIFIPYFTTKSGGTGLGLAMVKNIVELHQGRIWFQSEENKGSSFFVELPFIE